MSNSYVGVHVYRHHRCNEMTQVKGTLGGTLDSLEAKNLHVNKFMPTRLDYYIETTLGATFDSM